ncbi:MAG TPA: type III pantothenate kinase [Nitrospiria bacterium]|nr:type III pantothenate kinase [Nitrospiria bacterium]
MPNRRAPGHLSPMVRRVSRRARPGAAGPILLAIDIGNTNIVVGLFKGKTLALEWRLATHGGRTADEYGLIVRELVRDATTEAPSEAIISSVVPNLTPAFVTLLGRYFGLKPAVVDHTSPLGLAIGYAHPEEIGADRLVNAAAAYNAFGGPLIIVDFGTATTFCVVSADGTYLGGVIAPGAAISAEALTARAAKLSKVEWVRPPTVIGRDTTSSMQTGMILGHASMVDGIIHHIQQEIGTRCRVLATGGLTSLIAPASQYIETVRPHLTLEGLALIADRLRTGWRVSHPGTKRRPRA